MANQVYIIPRRNDLAGAGLYLKLSPIAGQKSDIYDGEHQDFNLRHSFDVPATTATASGAYVSGSLSTTPLVVLLAADTDSDMVNDALVTQNPEFGLEAYLREKVTNAINEPLPLAECALARAAIMARVVAGSALTAAGINTAINAAVTAGGLVVAATYNLLTGSSFGTVEEVIRILSGEAYITPADTIVGDQPAGIFITEAARDILVTAAIVAGNTQYGSVGHFLTATESGYRVMPLIVQTGTLMSSLYEMGGQLYSLNEADLTLLNSNNFAYATVDVNAWHPRAQALNVAGAYVAIPATGTARALKVYRNDGTCLENPLAP